MWNYAVFWVTVTYLIIQQVSCIFSGDFPEDGALNSTGLATKYGHPPRQFDVVTEDGYILAVYRLSGKSRIPVLLVHGLSDSSDTFLIRGTTSPAIYLANKGYDVWLANTRGNRYSRSHRSLNPDTDPAFWQFSFHEKGYYDLPAVIDMILKETGAQNLTAIGHSEGNTIFYVLGSERKEYNSKVNVLIALGPSAYIHNSPAPASIAIQLEPVISDLVQTLGMTEFLGDNTTLGTISHTICSLPKLGYTVCAYGLVYPLVGSDPTELEEDFFQNLGPHYPGGSSYKSLLHFLQVGYRKTFAQYDYGRKNNMKVYNSSEPPLYRLDQVIMPVALYAGANDGFSALADVAILRSKLPNVVYYRLIPREQCNHVDFVWGRTANIYFYPYLDIIMKRYNPL